MLESNYSNLISRGFCLVDLTDEAQLNNFRAEFETIVKQEIVESSLSYPKYFSLANLHQVLNQKDINNIRLRIIEKLNSLGNINARLMVNPLPEFFRSILGPDELIQKNVNLVIQRPSDSDISELHRDYPGNSEFELVVWVPMVDCSKEMSMYVLDFDKSIDVARKMKNNPENGWSFLRESVDKHAEEFPVKFGQALVFMTPLFHGSRVNISSQTRVSFNFRLKALFSPTGIRDSFSFWNLFCISEFTRRCIEDLHG